jgi:hypothetical protein
MSKMRIDFEVGAGVGECHADTRLCALESSKEPPQAARHPEVIAKCTCGRTKDFYAAEVESYIFVCNGRVILKYREESAYTFKFQPGA